MSEPAANQIPDLLNAIQRDMVQQGIDLLLAFHDGAHFIEKPNAVMVLSGFKSLGHALVILTREGTATLVVTPSWDLERAADTSCIKNTVGADDIVSALADRLARHPPEPSCVATAGLASMPWTIEERVKNLLCAQPRTAEQIVFGNTRRKNTEQIARARHASEIAEKVMSGSSKSHGPACARMISRWSCNST